jgi:radical SAM protein (TIGR01212 family)
MVRMPTTLPYTSYNSYLRSVFGGKTYKIVVASGLTCPTRDGTISKKACAFCDLRGSSSYFGKQGRGDDIRAQIQKRLPAIRARFNAEHFLAYFQSYTNTYTDDLPYLRQIYEAALAEPGISGLAIGTRPDCLADPVIDLLEELAQRSYVSLELGCQLKFSVRQREVLVINLHSCVMKSFRQAFREQENYDGNVVSALFANTQNNR